MSDKEPLRVILWAIPRTLSTVFEKCIGHTKDVQIINEPYAFASYFGPESKLPPKVATEITGVGADGDTKPGWFHESICTYQWVKDTLEAPYPGKLLIFSKDMAHCITGKFDMLPSKYRHTFIIRHPHKVFVSWKSLTSKILQQEEFRLQDMPEPMCPKKYGYGEMWDLVEYLKENGEGANPIVVDSDDLQASPVSVMRQYCKAVGIHFTEGMLQWPAGTDILDDWIINSTFVAIHSDSTKSGFYDAAFNSTQFLPPSKIPTREELTEDLLELVDASMPYYEQLYDMRIKP